MRFAGTNINQFLNRQDQYSDIAQSGLAALGKEQEQDIFSASKLGKGLLQSDAMAQMAEEDGQTMLAQANAQGQAQMASAGANAASSLIGGLFS